MLATLCAIPLIGFKWKSSERPWLCIPRWICSAWFRMCHPTLSFSRGALLQLCMKKPREYQLASLEIKVGGIVTSFTTRNRFVPGERLTLALVDGPFSHLTGEWQFKALSEEGSKVMLSMNFDFSSSLISSAFRRGFAHIADRLIYDFGQRADAVYGL